MSNASQLETQVSFVQWTRHDYQVHIYPIIIGASIGFLLFGITLQQFFSVFKLLHERQSVYSKTWWILTVLFWINLGDTITKFASFITYMQDIALVGPLLFLSPPVPATVYVAVFQGILTAYVQAIYIWRIVRITRGLSKLGSLQKNVKPITFGCLWLAGALSLACIIGFVFYGIHLTRPIVDLFPGTLVPGGIALGCASAADALLCFCMVYHLHRHRDRTVYSKTNFVAAKVSILSIVEEADVSVSSQFIRLTLETGLIPTITQILELIFLIVTPGNAAHRLMGSNGLHNSQSINFTLSHAILSQPTDKVYVVAALVLYEAALYPSLPSSLPKVDSSNRRDSFNQSSRDTAARASRFRDKILVTEVSIQQEDAAEKGLRVNVELENIRTTPSPFKPEGK
ncbi:hypothetical protein BT69DRAFT_1351544 [Atractiella rhizophila]|nr:hypothetical protein BT69DRAFT_1351544 [Atractiella rhizophila]